MEQFINPKKVEAVKEFRKIYKQIYGKLPRFMSLWEKSIDEIKCGTAILKTANEEVIMNTN